MGLSHYIAQISRRPSTYALSVMVGALFFLRAFDQGVDVWFERYNRGLLFDGKSSTAEESE